ncbi:chromosomal replication initiator protein DnaA [Pelagibacterium halotolerans]|uniref:Chromosomal replication initiator protein DnaA n=2 Tax=Pelagibacterium TaxID=1082930 RepID=G4R8K2_PELHB|nr:chromosomal replication initiator protein DnaA [Pelagibacterium halotolerans B2]SEA61088.1 chromosomal replication initiator protein DnaA [Pelagibacterium halotolerans]
MDSIAAADRGTWGATGGKAGTVPQRTKIGGEGEAKMTMDADQVWLRVRARLRAAVGEDVFTSWFARLELEEVVGDLAHLSVPTRFLCSWIQSNYVEKILEAFTAENETIGRLHLTVRVNGQARPRLVASNEPAAETEAQPGVAEVRTVPALVTSQPASGTRANALSGSALDRKLTFETFVSGSANEMALNVAKQVASAAANNVVTFNPVYIHSSVGLGKTHLLNAIAWAAGASDVSRNIVYLTADHFMYHFITAVQHQSALAFKEWLRGIDLLLIDDMQFLQGKSATEFGHTLSTLISGTKQVVVAGDAPPRDLEMLDDRVRSRLSGGLVIPITQFDPELRRAIVQKRADQAASRFTGLSFPAPVIDYVARSIVSHGRDLDGAVNRLVAANQLTGEPITVGLAEKTLQDLIRSRETPRVRIEDILKIVARHYKVPRNELLSSRRSRDVVRPRQIAMYLAKSLTSRSLPEIGRRFGGRDHTTVLHSVRKVEQLMSQDGELTQEIELLRRMLEE